MEVHSAWTKGRLLRLLLDHELEISYSRISGEYEKIECTRNNDVIPKHNQIHQLMDEVELFDGTKIDLNANVISVFNTKIQGWQSILVSSIHDIVII